MGCQLLGQAGLANPRLPRQHHQPPLACQCFLEAREAVRQQFAGFARSPFYQSMFTAAGFPEVSQGTWSDGMVDAVAVWGDERRVTEGLNGLFAMGATEILASPVPAGGDRDASRERTLEVLAKVAKSVIG